MNKKLFILSLVMFLCAVQTSNVIAWENEFTHPALTKKTVERSDLDDYLKTQLEMPDGLAGDAWKKGASFLVFQAVVFGEER